MALRPRNSVDDAYIDGLKCAVCTSTDLTVNHISDYPDFITCANCGSAFIVEHEGSWIMYGKISPDYPETSDFAVRQWTWLDAVRQRAEEERQTSQMGTPPVEAEEEPALDSQGASQAEEAIELPSSSSSAEAIPEFEAPQPPVEPIQEKPEVRPTIAEAETFEENDSVSESMELDESLAASPIAESPIFPPEQPTPDLSDFPALPQIEEQPPEIKNAVQDEQMPFAEEHLRQVQDEMALSEIDPKSENADFMDSPSPEDHSLDRLSTLMPDPVPPVEDLPEEESLQPLKDEDPIALETKIEIHIPVGEPAKDQRFKVIVKGSELNFPKNVCAHCLRTPVVLGVTVNGTLPDFKRPGERTSVAFRLPLCEQDMKRAEASSEAEKSAVLQAHLISGVVAIFVVILFLFSGVVNPREDLLISVISMLLIAILGYAIPAIFLVGRANRYPPTHDAAYVLTTLRVLDDLGDLETVFEWRNEGYAELFRKVNHQRAVGSVERVTDRVIIPDPEPSEVPESGAKPSAKDNAPSLATDDVQLPEE